MKKEKRGRKRVSGIPRRRLIRLNPENVEIFDRYSDSELADVVNRALKTIFPKNADTPSVPIVIRPVETLTETICRIAIVDREVRLIFPERRDDFGALVKRFRYQFPSGCWSRSFPESIDIIDRAAEIGNELLCGGFCVQVDSPQVQSRMLGRSFVPEPFKTIKRVTKGLFKDCFIIEWTKSDDCYSEAMKLTAAKYSDGSVYVPSEHYLEVEDFAELNCFVLSEGAIALAAEAKAIRESSIVVSPKRKTRKSTKRNAEDYETGIPPHLRDDADD
jgi:hypothetical protein